MSQILEALANLAISLVSNLGYPGIVLAMAAENVFPPIPSEAIMPLAGYLTTTGRFNFYLAIFSGVLGTVIGAIVLYYLGVWVGKLAIRKFLERNGKYFLTSTSDLDAAEKWFARHGEKSVLFARMIPIVRSIISIPAGFVKMPIQHFMLFTVIGASAWTTMETVVGVVLGRSWYLIGPIFKKFDFVVIGALGVLVVYYIFRKFQSKNSKSEILSSKQIPNHKS